MRSITTLRISIIVLVVACGLIGPRFVAGVPLLGMALYTWAGLRVCNGQPERLRALGDQIYFTAYASTIAAFAGLVLRIGVTGRLPERVTDIWLMAALGIICTVMGLLTMTILHDVAGLPPADQPSTVNAASDRQLNVAELVNLDAYAKAVERLVALSDKASDAISNVAAQVRGLKTAFTDVQSSAAQTKFASEVLRNSTNELQSVLDAFVHTLAIRLEPPAPRPPESELQ